ncbi:protein kinase [Polyangium sp. y55x31]|uniref:serine/threonine-protein kinase n=1 Tax=Polyangium sp. y55x31 TaxID=3042688 RepID=UPI0024825E74|nr:protein kinase [Polyangium sp. y55x31]MDI1480980.1 protein kinase [Polyangium sp. y55x31]
MIDVLRCTDLELTDLADDKPALVDPETGEPSGLSLVQWLGSGGMSAVFLAERDADTPAPGLSDLTPSRVAVKLVKPGTEQGLAQMGMTSRDLAQREIEALERVKNLVPPSEFVIGYYGHGSAKVALDDDSPLVLPWIALEYVETSSEGATLTDRVDKARETGVDPVRAHRLARGMLEGVRVLHGLGILHRDLKPDNVFVAGPLDDETPKIADCGIARVDGLALATVQGITLGYGGPEQALSSVAPSRRNPLVGPWTDVHALASTIWFMLTGEEWCRSMPSWYVGERRSLRTAKKLHRGFLAAEELFGAIDLALRQGASPVLPEGTWDLDGAAFYQPHARKLLGASMFEGAPPRFPSIDAFAEALLPPLEAAATRWIEIAAREHQPMTSFRKTRILPSEEEVFAAMDALAPPRTTSEKPLLLEPGGVVFLPGPWGFARSGSELHGLSKKEPRTFSVDVPRPYRAQIAASRWLVRGPGGGIALVGPAHVLLQRGESFVQGTLPRRADEGPVGPIVAALGDGRAFGVVTADAGEGGPELWLSNDGVRWGEPLLLPLGGEVSAIASGPLGFFVAGSLRGKKARALWIGYDQEVRSSAASLNDKPALLLCVAGAEGEAWAAGVGIVMRFDRGGSAVEASEAEGIPVAMGLDDEGVPWLVTEREVFRRHGGGVSPVWKRYHTQPKGAPRLVAIGFPPGGVRVVDAVGGGAVLRT